MKSGLRFLAWSVAAMLGAAAPTAAVFAQGAGEMPFTLGSSGRQAGPQGTDGKQIYERICQGCHMSDGAGAKLGPSAYPGLAANPKLSAKAYPAVLVINGLGAMPAFGSMLSDEQIAAVVNYLRASFGNTYTDTIAATEVKSFRPVAQARPTELRGR